MATIEVDFTATITDGLLTPAKAVAYLAIPDTIAASEIIARLGNWADAVDGCIDGALSDVRASIIPAPPGGLKAPTGATWQASRVEQTGILNFSATGSDRRYGQALPSLSNGAIAGGALNLSNTQIAALISLMTNPLNYFSNAQQQQLEGAIDALITFRKRADLRKTSYEI